MLFRDNAFYILDADAGMNRSELIRRGDKLVLLSHNPTQVQNAVSQLSVPRKRIIHEMSWLLDCAPDVARSLVDGIHQIKDNHYFPILENAGHLSSLSQFNYLLNIIESVQFKYSSEFANIVFHLIEIGDTIDIEQILKDLNTVRSSSGFPQVTDRGQISDFTAVLFEQSFQIILNKMTSFGKTDYDHIINFLSDKLSSSKSLYSVLAEFIFNDYEVRIKNDEHVYESRILEIADLRNHSVNVSTLESDIQRLVVLLEKWHDQAKPLIIIAKAKGLKYDSAKLLFPELKALLLFLGDVFRAEYKIIYTLLVAINKYFRLYMTEEVREAYSKSSSAYFQIFQDEAIKNELGG